MKAIEKQTNWQNLGVLPWFSNAWKLPAEDVMDIGTRPGGGIKIVVPRLARIANFDDLDPLVAEPNVTVVIVEPGRPLPGDAALVILPGSKSTISDLENFRTNGWDIDLQGHHRRGGHILGICGGYQMLGRKIHDPDGIEGLPRTVSGLGYLNVETVISPKKKLIIN
jgi:adenosylcobyric acid synthase